MSSFTDHLAGELAAVQADGLESDLLNNDFTRGWLLEDMPIVDP